MRAVTVYAVDKVLEESLGDDAVLFERTEENCIGMQFHVNSRYILFYNKGIPVEKSNGVFDAVEPCNRGRLCKIGDEFGRELPPQDEMAIKELLAEFAIGFLTKASDAMPGAEKEVFLPFGTVDLGRGGPVI